MVSHGEDRHQQCHSRHRRSRTRRDRINQSSVRCHAKDHKQTPHDCRAEHAPSAHWRTLPGGAARPAHTEMRRGRPHRNPSITCVTTIRSPRLCSLTPTAQRITGTHELWQGSGSGTPGTAGSADPGCLHYLPLAARHRARDLCTAGTRRRCRGGTPAGTGSRSRAVESMCGCW